jgi:predicted HNH restriction endonuclease
VTVDEVTKEQFLAVLEFSETFIQSAIVNSTEEEPTPSVEQFVNAFRKSGRMTEKQMKILQLHYHAPERTVTANQLATKMKLGHYNDPHAIYGTLGKIVGQALESGHFKKGLGNLVKFEMRHHEWHWIMRKQVAKALEVLGWVDPMNSSVDNQMGRLRSGKETFVVEGRESLRLHRRKERNSRITRAKKRSVMESTGRLDCEICGFDFQSVYGALGKGFAECHHLIPHSSLDGATPTRLEDLAIVCANCHRMLHRKSQLSKSELVKVVQQNRSGKARSD